MHPLDANLEELIHRLQQRTIPPLLAEVLGQTDQTLELRLVIPDEERKFWGLDAGVQRAPLALQGVFQVQLAAGAQVVLEFLSNNVRRPIVRTVLSGTIVSATLDARTIAIGPQALAVDLGPSPTKFPIAVTGSSVTVALATGKGTVDNAPPIQKIVKA